MPSPNSDVSKSVGQGGSSQDMTQEYDKRHGTYSDDRNYGGKPAGPGPGTLPNTPSPITGIKG